MPAAIVPASLEDRREAGEVGVDIGKRIHQGMTNAGLRRQVHDIGKLMLLEERCRCLAVGEINRHEAHVAGFNELSAAGILQCRIVVGIHVVDTDDVPTVTQQPPGDVEADKAGCAGDENGSLSHRHRTHV